MALTYDKLATTTLGSASSSVTFSSISQSYTDLVLVCVITKTASGINGVFLRMNGDSANNYSDCEIYGDGVAQASYGDTSVSGMNIGIFSDTTPSANIFHLMNYVNTSVNKTVLARANYGNGYNRTAVGAWRSTAAINSITITPYASTFTAGSTFNLYGIKAA